MEGAEGKLSPRISSDISDNIIDNILAGANPANYDPRELAELYDKLKRNNPDRPEDEADKTAINKFFIDKIKNKIEDNTTKNIPDISKKAKKQLVEKRCSIEAEYVKSLSSEERKNILEVLSRQEYEFGLAGSKTNYVLVPKWEEWISQKYDEISLRREELLGVAEVSQRTGIDTIFDLVRDLNNVGIDDIFSILTNKKARGLVILRDKAVQQYGNNIISGLSPIDSKEFELSINQLDLCQAISDLNTLARLKTEGSIKRCLEEWNKVQDELDFKNESQANIDWDEYNYLKDNLNNLNKIVQDFDNASNYLKPSQYCRRDKSGQLQCSPLENLHRTAVAARRMANKCRSRIKKFRDRIDEERIGKLEMGRRLEDIQFVERAKLAGRQVGRYGEELARDARSGYRQDGVTGAIKRLFF